MPPFNMIYSSNSDVLDIIVKKLFVPVVPFLYLAVGLHKYSLLHLNPVFGHFAFVTESEMIKMIASITSISYPYHYVEATKK